MNIRTSLRFCCRMIAHNPHILRKVVIVYLILWTVLFLALLDYLGNNLKIENIGMAKMIFEMLISCDLVVISDYSVFFLFGSIGSSDGQHPLSVPSLDCLSL